MLPALGALSSRPTPRQAVRAFTYAAFKLSGRATTGRAKMRVDAFRVSTRHDGAGRLALVMDPPASGPDNAINLVLTSDCSGSMSSAITSNPKAPEGMRDTSRFDLARQVNKALLDAMAPEDAIALVSFADDTRVALPMTSADSAGRDRATAAIGSMRVNGSTDLRGGVCTSLSLLRAAAADRPGKMNVCMAFTDGEPNPMPFSGMHMRSQLDLLSEAGTPDDSLWAFFGIGEGIDARLLTELAQESGGVFAQIFDGTGMITAIVEALTTARRTAGRDGVFTLSSPAPIDLSRALVAPGCTARAIPNARGGTDLELRVGLVTYGTPRHAVVSLAPGAAPMDLASLSVTFTVTPPASGAARVTSAPAPPPTLDAAFVLSQSQRGAGIALLHTVASLGDPAAAQAAVRAWVADVTASAAPPPEIFKDIAGEVALSVAKPTTWAAPNALTLAFGHENEIVPHFKARGCLAYGRDPARVAAQARIDAAFNEFVRRCPLVPSLGGRIGHGAVAIDPLAFIAFANNCNGECFAGDALVGLADGGTVAFASLTPGVHRVMTHGPGGAAPASVLLKTYGRRVSTVRLTPDGLRGTAWHPVSLSPTPGAFHPEAAKWTTGAEQADIGRVESTDPRQETVYNLVLAEGAPGTCYTVNGHMTVALGHGLTAKGVAHAFFGSRARVLDSLRPAAGFGAGVVEILGSTRDATTGLVTGFVVT